MHSQVCGKGRKDLQGLSARGKVGVGREGVARRVRLFQKSEWKAWESALGPIRDTDPVAWQQEKKGRRRIDSPKLEHQI